MAKAQAKAQPKTRDEIKAIVLESVMEVMGPPNVGEERTDSSDLRDDIGMDSLDVVEFEMALESRLDIATTDDMAEKCPTVGKVIDWLAVRC